MTHSAAATDRHEGLQAERTALAWTRTSLALLANGALLSLRDRSDDGLRAVVPPILAVAVALCAYLIARQRQRRLGHRPLPARIRPCRSVRLIGTAVLALILVTAIAHPI